MKALDERREPSTSAELAFCRLAHGSSEEQSVALRDLQRLIEGGARSKPWNFDITIQRARIEGHPDADWLPKLAAVINDDEPESSLDGWERWQEAARE